MKLSEGVEAAIHCITVLAQLEEGQTLAAAPLAEFHGVSPSYLLKHLKALVGRGILESVPGPNGGYRLGRKAQKITLLDVVLAIEGPAPAFRCREIRQRGPAKLPKAAYAKPCGINSAMLKAERAYRAVLAETSLAELLGDFQQEGDPRSIGAVCAFVAANHRPQG